MSKMIYIISAIFALMLTGCFEDPKPPEKEVVIKTETQKVNTPVTCEVPKVTCDFKGDGFTPTIKLLECVAKQKYILDKLREGSTKTDSK